MIRLGKSHRDLAMVGASAFAMAAVCGSAASAQTALSGQSGDSSTSTVKEVVVTGQRAALKSAQKIKQNADEIVDSIVADDIGKLPDRSVTETLQRIVGVTIDHTMARNDPEHFSVEGSGVNIRGLTYVRSELNGRDTFSANGGRALSFEDVSPELMAGVDVYKNPSAEQIEGAVGGLVNLRTALPFDFTGQRFSVSAQGSWGDLNRGKPTPSVSIMGSNRWQTPIGEIGLLVDFASSEFQERTDAVQQEPFYPRIDLVPGQTVWVPKGVSWRTLRFDRRREGDYAALQWRPNADVLSTLTFFRSHYKMHWDEDAIFTQTYDYNIVPAAGTQFKYDHNGVFQSGIETDPTDGGMPFNDDVRSANQNTTTTDVSWNLKWNVNDRLSLQSDLQYVRGTSKSFDSTVATGINLPSETVNRAGAIPTVQVDRSFMTNPANYYWAFTMDEMADNIGTETAWAGTANYRLDEGIFKSFKAGVRIARRDAETDASPYNWQAVTQTWMEGWYLPAATPTQRAGLAWLDQYKAPYQTYEFPNFFNGALKLPSPVIFPAVSVATGWPGTYQQLAAFRAQACGCNYTWTPTAFGPGTLNTQRDITTAAYGMLKFGIDNFRFPIDGNLGVRIVNTDDTAVGNVLVTPFSATTNQAGSGVVSLTQVASGVSAKNNFTDVLPSLNLRVKLTPTLQARFAVAKALARPDFSQLQAYTTLSSKVTTFCGPGTFSGPGANPCTGAGQAPTYLQTFTGSGSGNPNLRPTKSTQIDGTLEWYFSSTGSLTAAVFYKDLTDVVVNELYNVAAEGQTFTVTAPVDGARGTAKGFEIAYQQYFDFLPGPLKGFGVQGNFTHVDSEQQLTQKIPGATGYCNDPNNLTVNLNGCDTNAQTFGNPPLANLSKNAFNAILLYDRGPISGRLAYNWREKYLQAINVNPTQGSDAMDTQPGSPTYGQKNFTWGLPVWAADYGQLDGSLFYKLMNNKITVGLEAQNLTDATYKQLMQQHIGMMGRAWFVTGRRFTLSVRATF